MILLPHEFYMIAVFPPCMKPIPYVMLEESALQNRFDDTVPDCRNNPPISFNRVIILTNFENNGIIRILGTTVLLLCAVWINLSINFYIWHLGSYYYHIHLAYYYVYFD